MMSSFNVDGEYPSPQFFYYLLSNAYAGLEPYAYTSGRWLWRDQLERNSGYVSFAMSHSILRCSAVSYLDYVLDLRPLRVAIRRKEASIRSLSSPLTTQSVLWRGSPLLIQDPLRLTTIFEVATIKCCRSEQCPIIRYRAGANLSIRLSAIEDKHPNTMNP